MASRPYHVGGSASYGRGSWTPCSQNVGTQGGWPVGRSHLPDLGTEPAQGPRCWVTEPVPRVPNANESANTGLSLSLTSAQPGLLRQVNFRREVNKQSTSLALSALCRDLPGTLHTPSVLTQILRGNPKPVSLTGELGHHTVRGPPPMRSSDRPPGTPRVGLASRGR